MLEWPQINGGMSLEVSDIWALSQIWKQLNQSRSRGKVSTIWYPELTDTDEAFGLQNLSLSEHESVGWNPDSEPLSWEPWCKFIRTYSDNGILMAMQIDPESEFRVVAIASLEAWDDQGENTIKILNSGDLLPGRVDPDTQEFYSSGYYMSNLDARRMLSAASELAREIWHK